MTSEEIIFELSLQRGMGLFCPGDIPEKEIAQIMA